MAFTLSFGVLGLALVVCILVSSSTLWASARQVGRDARAIDAAVDLDRDLREYHRLGNLWFATRETETHGARDTIREELKRLIVRMEVGVSEPEESRLWKDVSAKVAEYFAAVDTLEEQHLPLAEVVRKLRPPLENALSSTASLRRAKEMSRLESESSAEQALTVQRSVGVVGTVLLALAVSIVVVGVRSLVLGPLGELQETLLTFRRGDIEARARGMGLREARELALRFNEMADTIMQQRRDQLTYLAAVAHDLRSPLAALKTLIELLVARPASVTRERLERLDRQLDRLTRMVDDLLDATQIESGNLRLKLQDFDLRDSVRAVVELYGPTSDAHSFTVNAPEEPVTIHADPLRVEQVISNLVSNAIKYSPNGGPVVVSLLVVERQAELAVEDRGRGIPPEAISDLFLPFHRRPGIGGPPGVGLGLSIVRRIVKAHGGRIDVESVPEAGSTFRVYLPLSGGA